MKKRGLIKNSLYFLAAAALSFTAFMSINERVSSLKGKEGIPLLAATLTIGKGNYDFTPVKKPADKKTKKAERTSSIQKKIKKPVTSSNFPENYYNTFSTHNSKKKYPIYTKHYTVGGKKYDNFYVKNNTDYNLNIGETIKKNLGFKLSGKNEVQVLIYHTHTSESFIDCDVGYYYSDYYPRTSDERYNVIAVGDELEKELKKAGIGVIHDKTPHDDTYTGSYLRSRATIEKYLKKYPKIKVTLDIHRDSIGSDTYKIKPTFTYKGKKGAQIMILSGYDPNGYFNFPNWNYNLRFALKLQKECETKYSGMTRPLDFGNFAYNMNINTGSLLIEVGSDGNTLDEAKYSGKLLGKALVQVLQNSL